MNSFRLETRAESSTFWWWMRLLSLLAVVLSHLENNVVDAQAVTPANEASKRTILDPFQITMTPLDRPLTVQDQLLVRYEIEQLLSSYFLDEDSGPVLPAASSGGTNTEVIYVAVARIVDYTPIKNNLTGQTIGARIILDGIVYYSDASTDIPTADDLLPFIETALDETDVLSALQTRFPSVTTTLVEVAVTPAPTRSPTLPPTTMQPISNSLTSSPTASPTATPTGTPTARPTASPTTTPVTLVPTVTPTVLPTPSPTFLPTPSPTFLPTPFPTPSPTLTATTLEPTSTSTTLSPTFVETADEPTAGSSPTATPTANAATVAPDIVGTAPSPPPTGMSVSGSPVADDMTTPTTSAPSTVTTTLAPATPAPPTSVDAVGGGSNAALRASDPNKIDSRIVAGAAAGGLLFGLLAVLLFAHRRGTTRPAALIVVTNDDDDDDDQYKDDILPAGGGGDEDPASYPKADSKDEIRTDKNGALFVHKEDGQKEADPSLSKKVESRNEKENKPDLQGSRFASVTNVFKSWFGAGSCKDPVKHHSFDDDDGQEETTPPNLALTDGARSVADAYSDLGDASDFQSEAGDYSLGLDVGRGFYPTSRSLASPSTTTGSVGSATMESFEQQRRHHQTHQVLRKDLLESPDLTLAAYTHPKTGQALTGAGSRMSTRHLMMMSASQNQHDDDDCVLTATDVSAASLAKRSDKEGKEEGKVDTDPKNHPSPQRTPGVTTASRLGIHPPTPSVPSDSFPESDQDSEQEAYNQEAHFFSSARLYGIFQSLWGSSKSDDESASSSRQSPRQRSRALELLAGSDENTEEDASAHERKLNGGSSDDWDPDDEESATDRSSSNGDGKQSKNDDASSSLLDQFTKHHETYKMQRLRTPPDEKKSKSRKIWSSPRIAAPQPIRRPRSQLLAPVAPRELFPDASASTLATHKKPDQASDTKTLKTTKQQHPPEPRPSVAQNNAANDEGSIEYEV